MTLLLGKDPWYSSFNGDYKNVNVQFGPGAFRTEAFEELYASGIEAPKPVEMAQAWETGELIESR